MKRGAPDHPKTRRLAAILNLKRWQVIGVLESLWHFTANYAKRGDIGKWTNQEIAAGIEWEGSPDGLIDALIDARFIDRSESYRLLVHDWQEHADQTVQRSDDVKKLGFASVVLAKTGQPMPLPSPLPLPKPSPAGNGGLSSVDAISLRARLAAIQLEIKKFRPPLDAKEKAAKRELEAEFALKSRKLKEHTDTICAP